MAIIVATEVAQSGTSTRQVPIFVTIPNKQRRLVAGLFAEGRIERESKTALVVPQTAVNENGSTPWVLKVQDGKAQRVDVTVGLRDEWANIQKRG